jgi:hypothetical protein
VSTALGDTLIAIAAEQVERASREPELLDCGHLSTPDGLAAGYASKTDDTRICYECAADEDRARVRDGQDLWAYVRLLDGRKVEIITWPGIVLGTGHLGTPTLMRGGRCRFFSGTVAGVQMHGRHYPDAGQYIRLRPYKDQPARA